MARRSWQAIGVPDIRGDRAFIYGVVDDNGEIRYVGKAKYPRGRISSHRCSGSVAMQLWLRRMLRDHGRLPGHVVLQEIEPGCDVDAAERFWIRTLLRSGADLLNCRGARKQVHRWKPEHCELLREALALGMRIPLYSRLRAGGLPKGVQGGR